MQNLSTFSLKIVHDTNPSNPFEDWDCEPPIMYKYGRESVTHHGTDNIISTLLDLITDLRLVLNRASILESEEIDENYIRDDAKNHEQTFADALRDELQKYDDSIDLAERLAIIAKVPHLRYDSRGYSQGDYADVLIILTPEWFKKVGANPKRADAILDGTKKLYNAWTWGDVYGFQLTEHRPLYNADGTLSDVTDDDIIDSCY